MACAAHGSPMAAMATTPLFAVTGIYLVYFHGPRATAVHLLIATVTVLGVAVWLGLSAEPDAVFLAICKALVDQHGGTLTGLSAGRGLGATFAVTLDTVPVAEALEPAGAAPGAAEPTSLRLLLVEDNEPTLEVMTTLLELAGHDVKPAPDVRTARKLAESHPFDLVVSDLGLPDGNGFDLMVELRDRYGLKGIAVSGFGMEEDLRRSRASGFLEHLVKPVDIDKLKAALARAAALRD